MNESQLATLRKRDAHLVRLIEAITDVQSTRAWSTLKEEFDGEVAKLNRLLLTEGKEKEVDIAEIYRFQGRLEEAKRISLEKLLADSMTEHDNIRRKINPPT